MDWLYRIRVAFESDKVVYSQHAKREMEQESFGSIEDSEVAEAVLNAEVLRVYEDEKPYPCALAYGRTQRGRPLHFVCAICDDEDVVIVVTVYEPDPERWVDFRHRR